MYMFLFQTVIQLNGGGKAHIILNRSRIER
jgi:hypothetical protein